MPELPEVETICRQLAPHLEGRQFLDVQILDPRWTRPADPAAVAATLRGATVERVGRSGKYLVWTLSGDRYLLIHLRMTGALLFDPPADPPHVRATFRLDGDHRLAYVDPRRFGTAHLVVGSEARDTYLQARLGAEPFTPEFTAQHLGSMARGRTAPVKAFVLDQRRIAGVGNIYADEALFRAGIHPLRPAGRLTRAQWARVKEGIESALAAGIEAKGATIDDFRHVDGAQGSFQDQFLVHRRAGEPCPRCGRTIRKILVGGRGTYVCERCQPRPRRRGGSRRSTGEPRPAGVGA
ncbi:MAG: bifunctional DNA-formamidopyrimidine glycosylase/DNA-(apurinic or apyrimidinic site) lyase [Solirubrobacterales bacterium]|nr:bifunctional DNA-formamidopyrimidine glycosylase/DNA-(apurinic or apyrimidinic site) lyase [Solirubrobacterales bacterium]